MKQGPAEHVGPTGREDERKEQPDRRAVAEKRQLAKVNQGHAVAANAKKNSLPERQNSCLPPDKGDAHRKNPVGHVLP